MAHCWRALWDCGIGLSARSLPYPLDTLSTGYYSLDTSFWILLCTMHWVIFAVDRSRSSVCHRVCAFNTFPPPLTKWHAAIGNREHNRKEPNFKNWKFFLLMPLSDHRQSIVIFPIFQLLVTFIVPAGSYGANWLTGKQLGSLRWLTSHRFTFAGSPPSPRRFKNISTRAVNLARSIAATDGMHGGRLVRTLFELFEMFTRLFANVFIKRTNGAPRLKCSKIFRPHRLWWGRVLRYLLVRVDGERAFWKCLWKFLDVLNEPDARAASLAISR